MALNLKALKEVQEDLNNRGSGDLYFYATAIEGETDIRLLPPLPHQNGIYFIEQIGYWIKKKFYVSPATFDQDCPIDEEIELAKSYQDPDINELLNSKDITKKSRFLIPILLLNCKFDSDGECTKLEVVDKKGKVLVVGPMLMKAINKVVVSRNFQNGTEDGIADRVKGHNIILDKTGKNLDTEYTAMGWNYPWEMEEQYYAETAIPDIIKITEDDLHSDDYLRAVIRNYLYGEEAPKEDSKQNTPAPAPKEAPAKRGGAQASAAPARRSSAPAAATPPRRSSAPAPEPEEEEEEEYEEEEEEIQEEVAKETPKASPRAAATTRGGGAKPNPRTSAAKEEAPAPDDTRPKRRSVISDLDNID